MRRQAHISFIACTPLESNCIMAICVMLVVAETKRFSISMEYIYFFFGILPNEQESLRVHAVSALCSMILHKSGYIMLICKIFHSRLCDAIMLMERKYALKNKTAALLL